MISDVFHAFPWVSFNKYVPVSSLKKAYVFVLSFSFQFGQLFLLQSSLNQRCMKNVLSGCSCDLIWNKNNDVAWSYVNMIFSTKWNTLRLENLALWFQQLHYTHEISDDVDGKEKYEEKRLR